MIKKAICAVFLILAVLSGPRHALAHCQIPCGIYDDKARVEMISEHITTIEKSIKSITELSAQEKPDYNQLVRWVNNKDTHAGYIQDIASAYFLAQRIRPVDKEDKNYQRYIKQVTIMHEMIIYAMKAKQEADLNNAEMLKKLVSDFKKVYF